MNTPKATFACLLLFVSVLSQAAHFQLTITGDGFASDAVIELYEIPLERTPQGMEILASGSFGKGFFKHSGNLGDIRNVSVFVRSSDGKSKFAKADFILEAGKIAIQLNRNWTYKVDGGTYNQLLIAPWCEQKNDVLKMEVLKKIAQTSEDPLARVMAYSLGYQLEVDAQTNVDVARGLYALLGEQRAALVRLKGAEGRLARARARAAMQKGVVISDFEAQNLAGKTVKLSTAMKGNNLVLVEFWASWCAPCRSFIPHLKDTYQRFHNRGFEIVSFTIDADKEEWQIASEEEDLPWYNLGDLKGHASPIATSFGVSGVPATFLVDAKTGRLVSKTRDHDELNALIDSSLPGE
ncbi:TlpA disulfide reductase family protein [Porticoccus sp. W117]|uniref:TlpA family protein disulfide reductase n=1 Tax=Porticoccus sp. W117 TaxID=3054777 RepID=UPI0025947E33|nr:TlpA disulfide reductase family protein [Porticoccus sp. W117]MDM3872020.1 TlpA disulfide reductase family protein [Porticoccus sp. W117]